MDWTKKERYAFKKDKNGRYYTNINKVDIGLICQRLKKICKDPRLVYIKRFALVENALSNIKKTIGNDEYLPQFLVSFTINFQSAYFLIEI